MERLDRIAYNKANEQRNTVQPQAVNLAYAEPCPDQIQARLFVFAGRASSECEPLRREKPVIRSSRGGAMIHSIGTNQRRLPPLQTGRADFPHPAYPRTLRSKACADRRRLGRRAETLPQSEVGRSLFWEQCSMCILTLFARRILGRAPSLRGHYPASSLL